MTDQAQKDGWYIPWLFVAFFVVIFLMNGVFLYFAISTHSGLETESAYEEGLRYNEKIEAAAGENALGWRVAIDAERTEGGETRLTVTLTDRDGRPLSGREVTARFARPVKAGDDLGVVLTARGHGRYETETNLPFPGQWDIRVLVREGERTLRESKRVVL